MKSQQKPREFRYLQLASSLESKINNGVYRAGEKVPSVRKLHRQSCLSIS